MKVIRTVDEMQSESIALGQRGSVIGFVPTMGALHEGHLSLMTRARDECETLVVSIFVNPTQFNEENDFDAYPRDLQADLGICDEAGVDIVFAPDEAEMYTPSRDTVVMVDQLSRPLCGMSRGRGHFIGVCTVVAKLFNIVRPNVAYFGQKDAQQALIIQRMARDLNFPVQIQVCPIVREKDGLALSSRNVRIPEELRPKATGLHEALALGRELIRNGEQNPQSVYTLMMEELLKEPAIDVDYLHIVSPETLEEVDTIDDLVLIAAAISIGGVRLIDNELVSPDGPWEE